MGRMSDSETTTTVPGPAGAGAVRAAEHQRAKNSERGPVLPTAVPWRAVIVFLVIALGGAWLVELPVWLSGEGLASPWFGPLTLAMMFTPTIAALVVVFWVHRAPSVPRWLGLWPLRPAGRTWLFIALGAVGFTVIPFAALLLGDAMGLIRLDLSGVSGVAAALAASGGQGADAATVVTITLLMLPIVTLVNCGATFGEELGWRGWLLPALRPLGRWAALLTSGVIWGVWHAPVVLLGYNYGRTDVLGVLCMVVFCVLVGTVIGWLRLRSASVWPAVVAHAALNTAGSQFLIFVDASDLPADPWGSMLGWPGWILFAVIIVLLAVTGQFRKQPQPGLTLAESRA